TFDWPVPITMMLSLAAGITVSISGNKLLFKNADGIEIGSKTLSDDDLKIVEQTIEGENYSNLTEVVSAKEAEVYLHFLESGSTEGMTESELKAVQKIEELIKSNKIDYDGILKIRNETVKSDVEVVRKTTEDSVEDVGKNAAEDAGKVVESGLKSIDNTAITHSSVGDFTYNPKTGAVSKMKGGGHGQANIEFLEANGLEYNIVKVYDNGVRIGNILDHKVKAKRTGTNQSWFPESWSESDIANAGAYIGNLLENVNAADGVTVFGNYNGVRVGVIRTNGRISTIFPDAASQP
ncbi:EndoU domain-containing protein, partial [Agathobacter rectalis]|uniref:EndoU domain-containing protein n=1 Tax=Agathobacter rectalis TaxID=39491 RepID=UPI0027D26714